MSKFRSMFPVVCPDTGETFTNYQDYLRGEHWRLVKQRYRASKLDQRCAICQSDEGLELHHKTYKRLGNERLMDLALVCRSCHQNVHDLLNGPRTNRLNIWSALKIQKQKSRKRRNRT